MRSLYQYLIKPVGDRYNNVKQIGGKDVIVNATMDETDFKYTNRIAEVIAVPRNKGELQVGDLIIVHHNTFRKWFNVRGNLKDSANFIKDGCFHADLDQIYAYDRGEGWVALEDYCFVEPSEKEFAGLYLDSGVISKTQGKVYITNPILEKQGVEVGDTVVFNEKAAYRFEIDGKTLYKMSAWRNIRAVL